MIIVITYGTYDLLHHGHIRLLERAKALGDYLIVGVTADDFDKTRGKINVQQSLMERVEAVRATGIADEIIIEEYEGQKIDDIRKYGVDIFTVGSDWEGKFDYLNEYCKVVYLERTSGVSSTELRDENKKVRLGLVGDAKFLNKVETESKYVNGLHVNAICTTNIKGLSKDIQRLPIITDDYDYFLENVDAVYIRSSPEYHFEHISKALKCGKHILCESPISISTSDWNQLIQLADEKSIILMDAVKTAYSTAYQRLLLLIKGGKIGKVVSVESTCTSLTKPDKQGAWRNIYEWGPTALLPVFQILGVNEKTIRIMVHYYNDNLEIDDFVKIDFVFSDSVGTIKVGNGVKSEGELVISGTEGYVYVPAPWWKTDYFEIRYENPADNKRYFYQLDGEGIRYELVAFAKAIKLRRIDNCIEREVSKKISSVMENVLNGEREVIEY